MHDLKRHIRDVADFPRPGVLFRDISPLLRTQLEPTIDALAGLLDQAAWGRIDAIAGIESRGFILASALAVRLGKGFVPIRKQGKLPPPVVDMAYDLEYGSGILEMQPGSGAVALIGQRVRFTFARSISSRARQSRTALSMNMPKLCACSNVFVGGITRS